MLVCMYVWYKIYVLFLCLVVLLGWIDFSLLLICSIYFKVEDNVVEFDFIIVSFLICYNGYFWRWYVKFEVLFDDVF